MSSRHRTRAILGGVILATITLSAYGYFGGAALGRPGSRAASSAPRLGDQTASGMPGPTSPAAPSAGSAASPPPTRTAPESAPALANRLGTAASPYLRVAAAQPVAWQIFGEDAFQLAGALDRPILLDVGGTWCHWCRVM